MNELIIAISAAGGALSLSLLGYLNSKEPFDFRKFIGSAITALVSGIGVAVTYQYAQGITAIAIMIAFLTGVGADAGRKVLSDTIRGTKE